MATTIPCERPPLYRVDARTAKRNNGRFGGKRAQVTEMTRDQSPKRGKRVKPLAHEVREYHPLQRLLLIDVLRDPESRPLFLWAGAMLLIGVLVYHLLEGWDLLDALYFCVVTLATIGYGDLTPTTPISKLFTIFYVINGIGILVGLFDRIRQVRSRETLRIRQDNNSEPPSESA